MFKHQVIVMLGVVFGLSWASWVLGASEGVLGMFWGSFGNLLGASWAQEPPKDQPYASFAIPRMPPV